MPVSKPVILVTVGPKAIGVAYDGEPDKIVGVPSAGQAPWRKHYANAEDHAAAMSRFSEEESDRAGEYVMALKREARSMGADVIVVVSKSATAHAPKEKVYSKVCAVEDLLTGLSILAKRTISAP